MRIREADTNRVNITSPEQANMMVLEWWYEYSLIRRGMTNGKTMIG